MRASILICGLLLAVFVSGIANATVIGGTLTKSFGNTNVLFWSPITNADTTTGLRWSGGKGMVEVTGTHATAVFEILFGTVLGSEQSVDSDAAPDGFLFSSAVGVATFDFPKGYFDISFSSVGSGSQSLSIKIAPIPSR